MSRKILISTSSVEPKLRNEFWRDVLLPAYVVSALDDDGEGQLEGSFTSRTCGTMTVMDASFKAQQCLRDRQHVLRSEMSGYSVNVVTVGTIVGSFPQAMTAKLGDIFIVDFSRTFHVRLEACSRISAFIPRESLERAMGRNNLHGFVLKSHWAVTRILTDYLLGLNAVADGLSYDESGATQDALVTLLAGATAGREIAPSFRPSELQGPLRQRILEYIDQHITDPDLGPQKLMKRFSISRTHLYRTFEAGGGVATLVREKRLDLAYQHLVSPSERKVSESIKKLCFRCGFSSPEHFNRIFKDRFGVTPNNLRTSEDKSRMLHEGGFDLHDHFKRCSSSHPE